MKVTKAPEPARADGAASLQHQIHLAVRAEILDGLWIGRNDFPGEVALAKRFGVSVITTRAVLARLTREGLVNRKQGRRPEVTFQPPTAPHVRDDAAADEASRKVYDYTLIDASIGVAPWEACDAFDVPAGSELWLCTRLRRLQGSPHSVTLSVQRQDLGKSHSARMLKTTPMPLILAAAGYPVASLERRESVTVPPPAISGPLGIPMQHAVLLQTLTQLSSDGEPLEWTRVYYHPGYSTALEICDLTTGAWTKAPPRSVR